jgi:hypothetical protein
MLRRLLKALIDLASAKKEAAELQGYAEERLVGMQQRLERMKPHLPEDALPLAAAARAIVDERLDAVRKGEIEPKALVADMQRIVALAREIEVRVAFGPAGDEPGKALKS